MTSTIYYKSENVEIARWHTQDPEQESHYSWNGYNYTFNNPINLIDPFGLDTLKLDENRIPDGGEIGEVKVTPEGQSTEEVKEQWFGIYLSTSEGGDDNGYRAKKILFSIEDFDLIMDFLGKICKGINYEKPRPRNSANRALRELKRLRKRGEEKYSTVDLEGIPSLARNNPDKKGLNPNGLDSIPITFRTSSWYKGRYSYDLKGQRHGPYSEGDTIFFEYYNNGNNTDSIRFVK